MQVDLSDAGLTRLLATVRRRTPGELSGDYIDRFTAAVRDGAGRILATTTRDGMAWQDAVAFAAAVNAVEPLIAEVQRLRAAIARVKEARAAV